MLNPVSSVNVSKVRFAGEGVAANPLERSGAFARPAEPVATEAAPKEKKGGHGLRNTIVGLVVSAAALVALKKTNVLKVLDDAVLKDAKFYSPKKIGHYLAQAGELIGKYTYEPAVNLFNKMFKGKAAS